MNVCQIKMFKICIPLQAFAETFFDMKCLSLGLNIFLFFTKTDLLNHPLQF